MQDRQLLHRYVRQGSQAAFADLVARHQGLVYSVCRREIQNSELAEEATQVVFLVLARKAPSLLRVTSLSGWLFQTARFTSLNVIQHEKARQVRERKLVDDMGYLISQQEAEPWESLSPLLNEAIARLSASDREAVLLRFFEGRSYPETGEALQVSEDAARIRVNRAVEKMRRYFAQHGVVLSGALVATLLTANAAEAVSETCAAGLSQISVVYTAGRASTWLAAAKIDTGCVSK